MVAIPAAFFEGFEPPSLDAKIWRYLDTRKFQCRRDSKSPDACYGHSYASQRARSNLAAASSHRWYTTRCVGRVLVLFRTQSGSEAERQRVAAEACIQIAERYARGDPIISNEAMAASSVALEAAKVTSAVNASTGGVWLSLAACNAAQAAAAANSSAHAFVVGCASSAADAHVQGALALNSLRDAAVAAARADFRALSSRYRGIFKRNRPIDPSESGPLGPLWPEGKPEWRKVLEKSREDIHTGPLQEACSDGEVNLPQRVAGGRQESGPAVKDRPPRGGTDGRSSDETKIIFVHGTFSGPQTKFFKNLRDALSKVDGSDSFVDIRWDGGNSFESRLRAELELVQEVRRLGWSRVLIIAHSHGGNIAYGAVTRLSRRYEQKVLGLVTFGTPFVTLGIRNDDDARVELVLKMFAFGFTLPLFLIGIFALFGTLEAVTRPLRFVGITGLTCYYLCSIRVNGFLRYS